MNQREARRLAHGIAAGMLQNFLDIGAQFQWTADEADAGRLEVAIDEMAQREFELGGSVQRISP